MSQATAPPIRRPAYREGQLLQAAELQAEQQSRTGALVRHEQDVHTPGIAIGLEVTVPPRCWPGADPARAGGRRGRTLPRSSSSR